MRVFHFFKIVQMAQNREKRPIYCYIATLALGLSSLLPTVVMIWHKHSMSSPISTNETRFFLANN